MGTKERLAEGLERLARLIPGIESYQDKEDQREWDKRLRETLVGRLDGGRKAVEKTIDRLQRQGHLKDLDRLGRLERKINHAADTIRFASRGYSGVFDAVHRLARCFFAHGCGRLLRRFELIEWFEDNGLAGLDLGHERVDRCGDAGRVAAAARDEVVAQPQRIVDRLE